MSAPVALVTGAASGLGWCISQQLAGRGYQLILVDRDAAALQQKATLLPTNSCLLARALDLTDSQALGHFASELRGLGRLDCLINNAGITHRSLAELTTPTVIRQVMAVNYQAPVELALHCLPQLQQRRGQIVNISSMAGWMPVLGRAGYCAAKSALHQYFEVLRAETLDQGLHILNVYPSFLDTPIEQNALDEQGRPNARARSMIGRLRTPEWMAAQIVNAMARRQRRLFPDRFTWFASILYKLFPDFFIARMRRKFAVELSARQQSPGGEKHP